MAKGHVIILEIENQTGIDFNYSNEWFDSGRIADHFNVPSTIASGEKVILQLYERDSALTGCSGYYTYALDSTQLTIAFSNPGSGTNKLGVGLGGKSIWDNMSNHDYNPFVISFMHGNQKILANCQCTGSGTNRATVLLYPEDYIYNPANHCTAVTNTTSTPMYPVGWLPYLADWKNYIAMKRFPFRYLAPNEISGVGVLVGINSQGKLIGESLYNKQCEELTLYPQSAGHYSWALAPSGSIMYVWNSQLVIDERKYTRHSDLNQGEPVICAGEFYLTKTGSKTYLQQIWIELNDSSGHYKPSGKKCFKYVLDKFRDLNIDTSKVILKTLK